MNETIQARDELRELLRDPIVQVLLDDPEYAGRLQPSIRRVFDDAERMEVAGLYREAMDDPAASFDAVLDALEV